MRPPLAASSTCSPNSLLESLLNVLVHRRTVPHIAICTQAATICAGHTETLRVLAFKGNTVIF